MCGWRLRVDSVKCLRELLKSREFYVVHVCVWVCTEVSLEEL